MIFEKGNRLFRLGKGIGYVFAYIVFTSFLWIILTLTKKAVPIYYVAGITLLLSAVGISVKRLLR
jgi:hypothetical protein